MNALEAWSSRSEERLLGLVKSIHSILRQHEPDLKLIPYTPDLWSGNTTESLIDRLRKLSQYVKPATNFSELLAGTEYSRTLLLSSFSKVEDIKVTCQSPARPLLRA